MIVIVIDRTGFKLSKSPTVISVPIAFGLKLIFVKPGLLTQSCSQFHQHLRAAYAPIFLRQKKITKPNCNQRKAEKKNTFLQNRLL